MATYLTWHNLYAIYKIGDKSRDFPMISMVINNKSDSTVQEYLDIIIDLILSLGPSNLAISNQNKASQQRLYESIQHCFRWKSYDSDNK